MPTFRDNLALFHRFCFFFLLLLLFTSSSNAIQCYSGNQFSIIECPSLYCIKQTLGLDTVRYCDGTGVSSICSTYRIIDACQSVPNLGYICCCSDQLCNSSPALLADKLFLFLPLALVLALSALFRSQLSLSQ